MSMFVPEADRLLEASAEYLEHMLLPTLDGYHRFQTRICVNALRIVLRELQLGASAEASEKARLEELLGRVGNLKGLNEELSSLLSAGELSLDHPGLVEHLRITLQDSLRINSPHWT